MQGDMLDVNEIAKLLHCSDSTVRRIIDSGALRATRLTETSPRRVHRDELSRYADERGINLDWSLINRE